MASGVSTSSSAAEELHVLGGRILLRRKQKVLMFYQKLYRPVVYSDQLRSAHGYHRDRHTLQLVGHGNLLWFLSFFFFLVQANGG